MKLEESSDGTIKIVELDPTKDIPRFEISPRKRERFVCYDNHSLANLWQWFLAQKCVPVGGLYSWWDNPYPIINDRKK